MKRLADEIVKRSSGEITVWIDTYKIPRGSHWRERITDGILKSHSVFAFLSAYSNREKSVCLDELSIALVSKHGMIRTILLEKPDDTFKPSSRVSEYQWGDMSDYPKVKKQGEETFSAYIEQEADSIIALVNSEEIRQYDAQIRALRRSFHMPDMDTWTKFDALINKERIGREWLFDRIRNWEEKPDGSRVLLLCGKPGAGKSMFSAHLQLRDPAVVAAFPCDCRHSEYSTTQAIILQIAYRLALRLPDYRRWVMERLNDPSYDLDGDRLYEDLILQPLSKATIDGDRASMVIIVDALDEMENDSLADFISRSADSMRRYVRFLVTSRKIPAIVERFSRFDQIDLDAEEEANKADLAAYYESMLNDKLAGMSGKGDFINRLIQSSGGVFTYAECVTNNILEDIKNGSFTIQDYPLPAGIEDLFRDTLDRSFAREKGRPGAPYTEADYAAKWRTPLSMILASPEPLPLSTLRSLMNWKDSELKSFRHPLFSLLTETDNALTLFHRSFGEWLERTDTAYAVSRDDGISALAEACFDVYNGFQDEMDEYMLLYTTRFLRESRDRNHRKQYRVISWDGAYTNRLFEKADGLMKSNAFARAMEFYEELLAIFGDAQLEEEEGRTINNRGRALSRMGGLHQATNQFAEALRCFKEDLEISRKLKEKYPENPGYLRGYSIALEKVAGIYGARKNLGQALAYYEESLAILRELKEKYPENLDYLWGYSIALAKVAGIYEARKNLGQTLAYYEESLAIRRKLKEKYPENPDYLRGYSVALVKVAGIYEARNDLGQALAYYEEELAIRRELTEKYPENPDYLRDYSVSLEKVAGIYKARNDLGQALAYYEESLAILRELKEKYPENLDYLWGYSIALAKVAGIYEARKNLGQTLAYYEESLAIRRKLKEKYPENPDYLRGYSVALVKVAGIYEARNDLGQALAYYEEELAIKKELKEKYPENPQYIDDTVVALFFCWKISRDERYRQEALEITRQHPELPLCGAFSRLF